MSDLIDRQAAIDAILAVTGNSSVRELYEHVQEHGLSDMWSGGVNAAIDIIIALPSAQPERKTGKWIQKGLKWECDQCGCRIVRAKPFSGNMWNYYYCPNCGVKMEEGEQDGQTN